MALFNSIPLLFFTPTFHLRSFWKTNLCNFLHPHFLFWLVGVYTYYRMWVLGPVGFFVGFGGSTGSTWTFPTFPLPSRGWGQDGRQRNQHPNCAGPHLGPWRVGESTLGNKCHLAMVVLGEWRVNLGQHCFCYFYNYWFNQQNGNNTLNENDHISHLDHVQRYRIW